MISFLKDAIQFLKCLSFRRLMNYCLLEYSYFLSRLTRQNHHKGYPAAISVEPTDHCNLRCPECPSGLGILTRQGGYVSWETYIKAIDNFKNYGISLNLYFQGEPFLHANLLKMINYASNSNIYTNISTNGQLLPSFSAEELINSGLNRLIISADGISQESYEKYRVGGRLDKLARGMKELSDMKKKLHAASPLIILQFIVWKHNEHEIPKVKKWALEHGADRIEFKTAQISFSENSAELLPSNNKFKRYTISRNGELNIKSSLPNECWKMWHSCVISWDGYVLPCCFDKDAHFKMGNIGSENLYAIWKSSGYNKFREGILTNRKQNEICLNCSEGLKI